MAGRFKDHDPNFPERTGLGKGLSDRTNERSMDEVRDYLKKLSKLLSGFHRRFFTDAAGNRWEFAGRPAGLDLTAIYGFSVIRVSDTRVRVFPSVVTGMGAWATVPQIGGDKLTDLPAPELNVEGKDWVALTLEVTPLSEVIYIDPTSSDPIYGVAEGAGILVGGRINVAAFETDVDMSEASQVAVVDPAGGGAVQNGKYVLPLALRVGSEWHQVGYHGPLGIRMCRSGAIVAFGPARAPGVGLIPEDLAE